MTINLEELGLKRDQPTLLSFGALWCKPCRAEISELNEAQLHFGSRLQMASFLVEGNIKGALPEGQDIPLFISQTGDSPTYDIFLDTNWKLFDRLSPPKGKVLPMLALIRPDGSIFQIVQENLNFESELKPTIEALLSNSPPPKPTPEPEVGELLLSTVIDQLEIHGLSSDVRRNIKSSWRAGLLQGGFSREDMPFLDGKINLTRDTLEEDWRPQKADWFYVSQENQRCSLTLFLRPDGTLIRALAICQ